MARFAFHKQGLDVGSAASLGDVLTMGRLDYPVAKVPVGAQLGTGEYRTIKDKWATVRTDNGTPLGVVGGRYTVVQNADAFEPLAGCISDGSLKPERAGTFDGGARAWMLSKFNGECEPAPGDKVDTHLLAMTGHDGSCAVSLMPITIRQVCTNGLTVCIGNKALEVTIRHGHSAAQRLERIAGVMGRMTEQTGAFFRTLEALARKSLPETEVRDYFQRLFPTKPAPAAVDSASLLDSMINSDRASMGAELLAADNDYNAKIIRQLLDNYHADRAAGTAWGAVNAVTEYTTHQMRTKGGTEGRLQSVLLGGGADMARTAYATAMQTWL